MECSKTSIGRAMPPTSIDQEAMEWRSYSGRFPASQGRNVLAVRGFNLDAHDPDFLLTLQLDGVSSIDRRRNQFSCGLLLREKNHQHPIRAFPL